MRCSYTRSCFVHTLTDACCGLLFVPRLIHSARVVEGKICYDIKDANQIYELFYTRFSLHKRIYNHKTSVFAFLPSRVAYGDGLQPGRSST